MLKAVSSITNAIGALNYKGTWNANTNSPALASGVGTKGDYYVVGTAGATTLDGISNWGIGDWVVFNGSVWQRVEGGADLNGVNLSVSGTSTLDGNVTFKDNLTQGTAAKGINFTANTPAAGMTGQLLNWYEEGTFTPTISSGITSVTYSTQNGAYTRIGRLVTFALRLELSAGTAAAAIVQIGGLPFTANISFRGYAGSWAYAAGTIVNSLSTNLPTLNVNAGSTTISFYNTQGAAFNGTDLSTAANFSVDLCGMYYA